MAQVRQLAPSARQAPYSVENEQAVLGAMLLDNRCTHDVRALLVEQDFFRLDHQLVFRGICDMHDKRVPCDFATLSEWMRRAGTLDEAGGLSYLGTLANETPSAANVVAYAELVKQRSTLRRLIAIGGDIAEMGYRPDNEDVGDLVAAAQRMVMDMAGGSDKNEPRLLSNDLEDWDDDFHRRKHADYASGLQTGLRDLDAQIVGLEPGDLMVIAGATSMGKTVVGLTIADNVLKRNDPVLAFSLEMPGKQLLTRQVASRGDVPLRYLRDPRNGSVTDVLHDGVIATTLNHMRSMPFYVNDRAGLTIQQIYSQAMRLKHKVDFKLLLIDYFQLIGGERRNGENRTNELDKVSRDSKRLAKDLGVPVILLAQVNDDHTKRADKRPWPNEIRECKALPHDADILALLYRDDYFDKKSIHKGIVELNIAKQRNGALGTVELKWQGGLCRVVDYDGPTAKERRAEAKAEEASKGATKPKGMT